MTSEAVGAGICDALSVEADAIPTVMHTHIIKLISVRIMLSILSIMSENAIGDENMENVPPA